jgi:hypothetical protein
VRGVTYINITDVSRQGLGRPELVASDGLHPSAKMYTEWVRIMLDTMVVQELITDLDTEKSFSIEIFPNPAGNHIRIENLPEGENAFRIIFCNTTGKTVFQKNFIAEKGKASLNIEALMPGAYFYELSGTTAILKTGKLIRR